MLETIVAITESFINVFREMGGTCIAEVFDKNTLRPAREAETLSICMDDVDVNDLVMFVSPVVEDIESKILYDEEAVSYINGLQLEVASL